MRSGAPVADLILLEAVVAAGEFFAVRHLRVVWARGDDALRSQRLSQLVGCLIGAIMLVALPAGALLHGSVSGKVLLVAIGLTAGIAAGSGLIALGEKRQAERYRRGMGLDPTPWMAHPALIGVLWFGITFAVVLAVLWFGTRQRPPWTVQYGSHVAVTVTVICVAVGTTHVVIQWWRRRRRDQRLAAADRDATRRPRE